MNLFSKRPFEWLLSIILPNEFGSCILSSVDLGELGGDENKKSFLSIFNTLQAPPNKKRKQMLKEKRYDYHTSGQAA